MRGPPNTKPKPKSLAICAAEMAKIKAYNVRTEEACVIVFHETPGKAKALALGSEEWYEDCDYIELTAKREPAADKYKNKDPFVLKFCENAIIYEELGWFCTSADCCDKEDCPLKKKEIDFLELV